MRAIILRKRVFISDRRLNDGATRVPTGQLMQRVGYFGRPENLLTFSARRTVSECGTWAASSSDK
jgi:hypothetical protein